LVTIAARAAAGPGRSVMSVILLVVGILVAGAGLAAIGFGIPINEFSLGTTLIMAGTTGLAGGLVLIGLATVVSELSRLGEALRARPAARPARQPAEAPEPAIAAVPAPVAVAPPPTPLSPTPRPAPPPVPQRPKMEAPQRDLGPIEPRPVGPSAVEVSAAAIERLRSSIPRVDRAKPEPGAEAEVDEVPLSPNGSALPGQHGRPIAAEPAPEPRAAPPPPARSGDAAAVDALKASRLDFLFRSKPAARPAPNENFDAFWAADGQPAKSAPRDAEPRLEAPPARRPAQAAPQVEERYVAPAPPPPAQEPTDVAILKSGVVDGMAYTLYADGSIEAKLPHGTVRFGSIAELRTHIESNS
jgi:hypothetical protein